MRDKARKALLDCGMQMNHTGFLYILDAIEIYEENGSVMTNMKAVYEMIARKRRISTDDVMQQIKYAVDFGRMNGNREVFNKYFGNFIPTNGNSLAWFWQRLKEEERA